ncbi:MAG: RagB/SusD family nutrient uptake outer membrane protein [Butyricimonas paravirosa]
MDGTGTGTITRFTCGQIIIGDSCGQSGTAVEEEGDTKEYAAIKGEALVCRAFCHFILVNLFAEHCQSG